MPYISVVLIFLDAERFIGEAIESVVAQSFTDWELILVDDGSTDHSAAIAQEFANADPRIRYTAHPDRANHGMSASRNLGAEEASGEYLAFLDADDVWMPQKLTEQLALLQQMPDVALVHGALLYWHSWDTAAAKADELLLTGGFADRRLDPPDALLAIYPLGPGAGAGLDCLARRDAFQAVGGFERRFRGLYEDQAFLAKIYLRFPIYISSKAWLLYRQHPDSCCATSTRSRAQYRHLRGIFLKWLAQHIHRSGVRHPRIDEQLSAARRQLRRDTMRHWFRTRLRFLLGSRS